MLAANTILQSRYRIIRELGHGGMGTVYEAIDERVNCLVALKTTRAASAREAELLANLRHPALPKVTDYFSDNDGYFLVMEYIPGDDFGKLLHIRGNPFPESDVLQWADKLLDLLQYLHGKQLLHRDIKPANLKLTGEGELFLLDFGLAKGAVGQMPTVTSDKSVHGYTLQYSSLEQILKKGTDARSDIYSLGATLYHLLTGVLPIDANTRATLLRRQGRDPLTPIQNENSRVSPGVATIIHRAMALDPDDRPPSAREMREALRKVDWSRPGAEPSVQPRSKPTEPSPPPVPPVSTIPGPSPPKPAPWRPTTLTDVQPEERPSPAGSILKPLLIVIGVVLLLTGLSVAISIWRTGWAPWSDKNIYNDGKTDGASNNNNANTSPVVVTSQSPHKPTTQTPSAGSLARNQIGMDLVWIPSGSFIMGSANGAWDQKPVHQVTISNAFYLGRYEVTQAQWLQVMGNNPSYFKDCGGNCPVEQASWIDAQDFIDKLNRMDDGFNYRLPSEAEWEYACRAGTKGNYYGSVVDDFAWYFDNSGHKTHAVGGKQPNAFGLYDMSGNVSEWCEDWYGEHYYGSSPNTDPKGPDSGQHRVERGGTWESLAPYLTCVGRGRNDPATRNSFYGFRVVAIPRAGI